MSEIQDLIESKGLNAPRIHPEDVESTIEVEHYFTAAEGYKGATGLDPRGVIGGGPLSLLTFCVLVLENGFTVTGESFCFSPENFDAEVGRKVARQNAINKVWPLLGYALRDKLHRGE